MFIIDDNQIKFDYLLVAKILLFFELEVINCFLLVLTLYRNIFWG